MTRKTGARKIGVIVLARYNSKRLPGKALIDINGKKALGYIIEKLRCLRSTDNVIVATSTEPDDQPIVDFCRTNGVEVFRGSKENVAQRILDCAKKYDLHYFVRICGDNILTDHTLVDTMIDAALRGNHNLVSNVKDRTFPSGISVEVIKTEFFESIIPRFLKAEDREHVTSYLYDHEAEIGSHYYIFNDICPEAKGLKLSLDDNSDLDFIRAIVKKMNKGHTGYLLKDIYELSKGIVLERSRK